MLRTWRVMPSSIGAYVVRHVPPHALMAVVGLLVSALALFQLAKSFGQFEISWP